MTEKEFLTDIMGYNPGLVQKSVASRALDRAKEAGAKFDLEPVELPSLEVRREFQSTGPNYYVVVGCKDLTQSQAREIIRRCEVVFKLKSYILSRFARMSNGEMVDIRTHELTPGHASDILDILDGRK